MAASNSIHTLRNARLPDGQLVDIDVDTSAGTITAVLLAGRAAPVGVENPTDTAGHTSDDLDGMLVLPAMVEPHAHLDKALTADVVHNPAGDLDGAIAAWIDAAQRGTFTHDNIVGRATAALELLVRSGVTAVRTHVDVGGAIGASGVIALAEVRKAMADLVDVQIVALNHSPMTGEAGAANRAALVAAIEAGADLIGGCPHLEPDGETFISYALDTAANAGKGLDLHVDETLDPSMLTLRDLARQVQDRGFEHAVTASHCVSLGMQPADVQRRIADEVAAANITVVTLPQTNLFLQGRDRPQATPRGLTAIGPLRDAGALVAAGADNVQDPFNLVGRSDPLETAALLVIAAHLTPDVAYGMVANEGRRALGLRPVEIVPGAPADLVAIDAPSVRGAVADAPPTRSVYRGGRLVARTCVTSRLHRR